MPRTVRSAFISSGAVPDVGSGSFTPRISVGLEHAPAHKTIPTILVADEAAGVERELRSIPNHLSGGIDRERAGETLRFAHGIVREIVFNEYLANSIASGVPLWGQDQSQHSTVYRRHRCLTASDSGGDPRSGVGRFWLTARV